MSSTGVGLRVVERPGGRGEPEPGAQRAFLLCRTPPGDNLDTERLVALFTSLPGGSRVDFQDLAYVYDPAGNPSQITDNLATSIYTAGQLISNTRTFRYDARYRLVRATGKKHNTATDWWADPLVGSPNPVDYAAYDFTYGYDAAGNLTRNDEFGATTLNYKATRVDLYNGDSAEATNSDPSLGNWRYDANGNCTKTPQHGTLGYGFDDQLTYANLGGGGQVRYGRHGDQRVVRMVQKTGVTALGIYLGPIEFHWRDGSTAYTKLVLHVDGVDGRVGQVEKVVAGSDPDSLEVFHVHGDHLGSGHVLTNAAAAMLSQEEFFAYGRASDRRDGRNRYRYIGVERDEDTGLCMTGPRVYLAASAIHACPGGASYPRTTAARNPSAIPACLGGASYPRLAAARAA